MIVVFLSQHLSEVQHLNLGFNRMDGIPVVPSQAGLIKFQLTTLILRNNNLNNMKGLLFHVIIIVDCRGCQCYTAAVTHFSWMYFSLLDMYTYSMSTHLYRQSMLQHC